MPKLSDTIARLSALRAAQRTLDGSSAVDRLSDLTGFGTNPGNLRARFYIPHDMAAGAALVVVLHGCTQTAAGYDTGSGWSQLADEQGFALLFPEQRDGNNPNRCFNWFLPEHAQRGRGEALSIRQMIEAMVRQHGIDRSRIFVTGLSAGGAMTSVMLATYPEVFAGGAIIAGLPYASAASIPEAFDRMRGHGGPNERQLTALVRAASDHRGPWPTISVWHGSGDATVNPTNAGAIVDQWRTLHGLSREPTREECVDGYPRRVWCDTQGRELVEEYSITGMGHGTPLATHDDEGCGVAGAFMLEASISSTRRIAQFWGIMAPAKSRTKTAEAETAQWGAAPRTGSTAAVVATERLQDAKPEPLIAHPRSPRVDVGAVINNALRAAGLMK